MSSTATQFEAVLKKQNSLRFHELDSLRGLAACTVVLCHFWAGLGTAAYLSIWRSPLRFLVAGHDAVILFFILSGFVLALPWTHHRNMGYASFIIKRICRIYLPYLAALMLAITMNASHHGLVTGDKWVNLTWSQKPDVRLILQHIMFVGDYQWDAFNTAFWSLVYEMRISIIFPLLAIAVLRFQNGWMLVFALFTSLLSEHYSRIFALLHVVPEASKFTDTLHYMSFFVLGAILANNREAIQARYKELPRLVAWTLIVLGVALYYHPLSIPGFAKRVLTEQKIVDWIVAMGSIIIIGLALSSGVFKRVLNHGAITFLGRISYSLYLVHGTVLFVMIYMLHGQLKMMFLPIYLAGVLSVTTAFYMIFEKPSMILGQKLGKLMSSRHETIGVKG